MVGGLWEVSFFFCSDSSDLTSEEADIFWE